jgi:2-dehydropantoate 2-reductase
MGSGNKKPACWGGSLQDKNWDEVTSQLTASAIAPPPGSSATDASSLPLPASCPARFQLVNRLCAAHTPAMDERIVIAGAGSIGCFVGGLLAAGGRDVTLLARPRIAAELAQHGLHLTSFEGWQERLPPGAVRVETDPAVALAGADLVLVTVKSGGTREMAGLISAHAPPGATVVSLQNGLTNAAALRSALPSHCVLAGMVPFNVVALGAGRFHRGTSGNLLVEEAPPVTALLSVPHLAVLGHPDMAAVQAGKLLLNLNNALNALSGLTLFEQLGDRRWRRLLARCQEEGLAVLRAHGIRPWSMGPLPAAWLPRLLRLPTPLFRLLARSAVRIDRTARSSMWEDLEKGRQTEIAELQGRIVAMAEESGLDAPLNRAVLAAIRQAEQGGAGSPRLQPEMIKPPAS